MKENATDQELVQRVLTGGLSAFEEIVIRYQQAVYGVVFRLLRNQEEAEDIAQESFIKCYQNLAKYDQKRPFAPWICRIAGNLALSRLRQLKRRRFLPWEQVSFEIADTTATDPAEALEENEVKQKVARCIKQLNPIDQMVVILRYYREFSYDEIAYILQTRRNNVEVRLCRARKKLHQMLEEKQEVERCSPAGK